MVFFMSYQTRSTRKETIAMSPSKKNPIVEIDVDEAYSVSAGEDGVIDTVGNRAKLFFMSPNEGGSNLIT